MPHGKRDLGDSVQIAQRSAIKSQLERATEAQPVNDDIVGDNEPAKQVQPMSFKPSGDKPAQKSWFGHLVTGLSKGESLNDIEQNEAKGQAPEDPMPYQISDVNEATRSEREI